MFVTASPCYVNDLAFCTIFPNYAMKIPISLNKVLKITKENLFSTSKGLNVIKNE